MELWTTEWDYEKMGISIITFYSAIEREENNLSVHTKMAMGYMYPEIESRKEAYQYSLWTLRTITHSLAISQKKSEEVAQFHMVLRASFMVSMRK